MRALTLLVGASLALLLAAAACDGARKPPFLSEASPTATAEATPTAAATPTSVATPTAVPEEGGMTGFRAFAEQIGVAVYNADGSLFEDRARQSDETCAGTEELGPCAGKPAGTELEGLWRGLWRTDLAELVPPGEIASDFEAFVAEAEDGESDGFGTGNARLYALASSGQGIFGEGEAFYAVATAIQLGDAGAERRIEVYQFTFDDERWRLYGVIEAGALFEEWLTDGCGDCYDHWELEPGLVR
ncbi:MAG: hypothetical protein Q8Q00_03450 [Dehalococcoidia bacterium]|nr:hypothetical protein [Dehalococcoidia bacterium]